MIGSDNCEKYQCTLATLKSTLTKYGVAVLPNIVPPEKYMAKLWADFKSITGIDQADPKTWKKLYSLYPLHSMLLQHCGLGHMQTIWDMRQDKTFANVFAHIWGCSIEDLLVSFDGLAVHFPPETTGRGWFRGKDNLHIDSMDSNFSSVQSLYTFYDLNPGDATFHFLEGSYKLHAESMKRFPEKSWWRLDSPEKAEFYRNCPDIKMVAPAGSLILWDSRTVHTGIPPRKDRKSPNKRLVVYLCYSPRKWASEAALRKKVKAFKEGRMTTHVPHAPKLFSKYPRTYGGPMPDVKPVPVPVLTDLGKRLAGF